MDLGSGRSIYYIIKVLEMEIQALRGYHRLKEK